MRKIRLYILLSILVFLVNRAHSQTNTENYIISFTPDSAVTDLNNLRIVQRHPVVQYMDGLGRAKQTVSVQVTPNGQDMVQAIVYDKFGRQKLTYLPFARTNNGLLHTDPTNSSNWTNHYNSGELNHVFSEKKFDGSPLNRVVEQAAPGAAWQMTSGRTVKVAYASNVADEVICWQVNASGALVKATDNHYAAAELYKTITKDENWISGKARSTEEFKDKQGQVVLKRSWLDELTAVSTYYVYDDYGLLRYVLPPKAFEVGAEDVTSTELAALCYQYKYDGRKRMTEKKLPGAAPVYMVYDNRDRLVATQDGNQREEGKWFVTKYDALNRPVMTAFYTSSKDQGELQTAVNDAYDSTPTHVLYESAGTALGTLYDNQSFPTIATASDILTVNYYDKYPTAACSVDTYSNAGVEDYEHAALLTAPKGQVTASWVKVLNGDAGKSTGLWTVNFYDNKYRVVQTYSENYLNGYDLVTNEYDFVGKLEKSMHKHAVGSNTIYEEKFMTYDHGGRLLKVEQEYSGSLTKAKATIAEMVYDELGQLKKKKLTAAARDMDYEYNIRGWLTSMNAYKSTATAGRSTDEFGFALNYNTGATGFDGQDQFNGNIGAMEWWSNGIGGLTNHRQAYGYSYDALNRITNADFKTYSSGWSDASGYDVTGITYDLNGNIKSLNRYDAGNHIDQLAYGYSGNQLSYVNDAKDDTKGFKELSSTSLEYTYDANGNMTRDDNKKISDIDYNLLNLPEFVEKKDGQNNVRNLAYAYDATGVKLENRLPGSKKLQYCANFVYDDGSLKYIMNEEGKLNVGDGSNSYQFFVKDHLGNTRLSVKEDGTVEELNHYYPFGMRMAMANSKSDPDQKYLYNGKEMQDETDWLDYGRRMFDPALGRFFTQDRFAEKYFDLSPYQYAGNNPIFNIDFMGDSIVTFFFDQSQNPNNKRVYTATVYVEDTDNGTVSGPYQGSTFPNNAKKHNTVNSGDHKFNNASGHKGGTVKGLNVVDENGSRTNTSGKDSDGNATTMEYVNVHSGVPKADDPSGLMRDNRGSEGCPTIKPEDNTAYMSNFDWSGNTSQTKGNSDGTVRIYRGASQNQAADQNYLKGKVQQQNFIKALTNGTLINFLTNP